MDEFETICGLCGDTIMGYADNCDTFGRDYCTTDSSPHPYTCSDCWLSSCGVQPEP